MVKIFFATLVKRSELALYLFSLFNVYPSLIDWPTKVRVNQLCQDRAFNSFAICLAYESSASFKVKCEQVWPFITI